MTADFKRTFLFFGESLFVGLHNLELTLVHPFHKAFIESAKPVIGIRVFNIIEDPVVAADIDFIAADYPQNGLDNSFRHAVVSVRFIRGSENIVRVNVFISVVSLDADFQRLICGFGNLFFVFREFEIHRSELLVQRRYEFHKTSPV